MFSVDDDVTVGKFYATFLIQDYFRSTTPKPIAIWLAKILKNSCQ